MEASPPPERPEPVSVASKSFTHLHRVPWYQIATAYQMRMARNELGDDMMCSRWSAAEAHAEGYLPLDGNEGVAMRERGEFAYKIDMMMPWMIKMAIKVPVVEWREVGVVDAEHQVLRLELSNATWSDKIRIHELVSYTAQADGSTQFRKDICIEQYANYLPQMVMDKVTNMYLAKAKEARAQEEEMCSAMLEEMDGWLDPAHQQFEASPEAQWILQVYEQRLTDSREAALQEALGEAAARNARDAADTYGRLTSSGGEPLSRARSVMSLGSRGSGKSKSMDGVSSKGRPRSTSKGSNASSGGTFHSANSGMSGKSGASGDRQKSSRRTSRRTDGHGTKLAHGTTLAKTMPSYLLASADATENEMKKQLQLLTKLAQDGIIDEAVLHDQQRAVLAEFRELLEIDRAANDVATAREHVHGRGGWESGSSEEESFATAADRESRLREGRPAAEQSGERDERGGGGRDGDLDYQFNSGLAGMLTGGRRDAVKPEGAALTIELMKMTFGSHAKGGITSWFIFAALVHIFMDGLYVVVLSSSDFSAWWMSPWQIQHTGESDLDLINTLQGLFAFLHGPLSLWAAYGMHKEKSWFPVLAVVVCYSELYGRVILIATFDSLVTKLEQPNMRFLGGFVFWNLLWLLVPATIMWYTLRVLMLVSTGLSSREDARRREEQAQLRKAEQRSKLLKARLGQKYREWGTREFSMPGRGGARGGNEEAIGGSNSDSPQHSEHGDGVSQGSWDGGGGGVGGGCGGSASGGGPQRNPIARELEKRSKRSGRKEKRTSTVGSATSLAAADGAGAGGSGGEPPPSPRGSSTSKLGGGGAAATPKLSKRQKGLPKTTRDLWLEAQQGGTLTHTPTTTPKRSSSKKAEHSGSLAEQLQEDGGVRPASPGSDGSNTTFHSAVNP